MSAIDLSAHAGVRVQQRGAPHHLIDALLEHADIDAPAGGGCRFLRVSRWRLQDRSVRAELGSRADRLARLVLVWNDATASIVTVLHHHEGLAGRRYRTVH